MGEAADGPRPDGLHEIDPRPERDEEGRWRARVRVVTGGPDGSLVERVLEPSSDVAFDEEEAAREHATRLALRWFADRLRGEGDPGPS